MLKPNKYIKAKVPTIDKGRAIVGIITDRKLCRKRNIAITTSIKASNIVKLASFTDSLIEKLTYQT
ncbi:hypothetical protein RFEPED_0169 [Rickettsia felis str. Pedreira]|uniref:Uncharacterized protein n=1 Tax=Rickettsia felis str. Pedreira TaxID=1359196 RepID=A0A0F3MQT1_RICFI|nr:hypothetical protein RFEPED_0169 [Rickettsia felis str. Pedreira]